MQSNHVDRKASQNAPRKTSRFARALGFGIVAAVSLAGAGFGAVGCLTRPLCEPDCHPHGTNLYVNTVEQTAVDKIDLLFMIDNSSSMADKQNVMKDAVPDLIKRLVSPNCVDKSTDPPTVTIVGDPTTPCPGAATREFTPITNIHVGIVSSSLGAHGATNPILGGCLTGDGLDNAELVGSLARYTAIAAPTPPLDAMGFLDWNPGKYPGEAIDAFNTAFANMVGATGQNGCGYEAQLEAIYRFLADPAPPQSIVLQPCSPGSPNQCAFKQGVDQKILDQRAAFLRPDSLLAVIMLTDENDCSVMDDGMFYYVLDQQALKMPAGSSQCDNNPNDPCCYSCGTAKPANCQDGCAGRTAATPDKVNLRCYREKQRFGLDFLYPTSRYVNALKNSSICTSNPTLDPADPGGCPDLDGDGKPDVAQNPIFAGTPMRSQGLVFFAGIVGVPWQDIAVDPNPAAPLVYQDYDQMVTNGTWGQILGDLMNPAGPVEPSDAHMIEATSPRGGLAPPGSARFPTADAKNGHEYANANGGDLEYACIFQLPQTYDCAAPGASTQNCDCVGTTPTTDQNPLCQATDTTYGNIQYFAKAYPGLRELQTLHDFGGNSIVASICARNLDQTTKLTAQDYGYRPAVTAIVDRLSKALKPQCLPRKLTPIDTNGDGTPDTVPCSILEASPTPVNCSSIPGRSDVTNAQVIDAARDKLRSLGVCDGGRTPCSAYSFCQLDPAGPECKTDPNASALTPGWCYIDPTYGDPDTLVKGCPSTQQRIIRFVGENTPATGSIAVIACFGSAI